MNKMMKLMAVLAVLGLVSSLKGGVNRRIMFSRIFLSSPSARRRGGEPSSSQPRPRVSIDSVSLMLRMRFRDQTSLRGRCIHTVTSDPRPSTLPEDASAAIYAACRIRHV